MQVRDRFGLYNRQHWRGSELRTNSEMKALEAKPDLVHIFLFHGDGRVRQKALDLLSGLLLFPSTVYALFRRLNDWSAAVRDSAHAAAGRCLAKTEAKMLLPALLAIIPHAESWRRWGTEGPAVLDNVLARQDVVEALVTYIVETRQSGAGRVFREICRSPHIDSRLESIARDANLPHIRAMALGCLVSGFALWPERRRERVWVDRSLGKYRIQECFGKRSLTLTPDLPELLQCVAYDTASIVRKQVADGLIRHRKSPEFHEIFGALIPVLETDKNIAVRERIEFLKRKMREEAAD